jgi:hypothetical protein
MLTKPSANGNDYYHIIMALVGDAQSKKKENMLTKPSANGNYI